MGLQFNRERNPPPTVTDYMEDEKCASAAGNVEKTATGAESKSRQEPHHHDPAVEARVVRKFDCRVPVLLGALYLVSFLDRSNIGYGSGLNVSIRRPRTD